MEYKKKGFVKKKFAVVLILILLILLINGHSSKDSWYGVVYPDRNNLMDSLRIGRFDTLEECGAAAIGLLDRLGALDTGDYECGKNCRPDKDMPSQLICKETEKPYFPLDMARTLYPRETVLNALENVFLIKIYRIYRCEYLTYPGMFKVWCARKAISIGIPVSGELKKFTQAQKEFVEAVMCLRVVSDDLIPTIGMSPTEFEICFNILAEAKKLSLKLPNLEK